MEEKINDIILTTFEFGHAIIQASKHGYYHLTMAEHELVYDFGEFALPHYERVVRRHRPLSP
ncbi:hypothetical protein HZC30_00130 [Candidatus Woesearchaeota archaeon]|nr:hypothetical protein [Candidatus Woesearchaeota archaeon]